VIRAIETPTVQAEPVEALRAFRPGEEGKGFDKLSPNGLGSVRSSDR
jgi:hypothetical protein